MIDATTPVFLAARHIVADRSGTFLRYGRKALRTLDPDDIHDFRVASRRFSEALQLFGSLYTGKRWKWLRKEVKAITRGVGLLRNLDEMQRFLTDVAAQGDVPAATITAVQENIEKERRHRRDVLKKKIPVKLLRRLRRCVEDCLVDGGNLFHPARFAPLAGFALPALHAALGDIAELAVPATDSAATEVRHRLRIAFKHFRYRLEILAPCLDDSWTGAHATAKRYQDLLGTAQDLEVFAAYGATSPAFPFKLRAMISVRKMWHLTECTNSLVELSPPSLAHLIAPAREAAPSEYLRPPQRAGKRVDKRKAPVYI